MVDIGSLWEILKITAAVKNAVYEKMVELSRYFGEHDYHLLMDMTRFALFGALALGSIGDHFPDTDPAYKDADSIQLLKHVHQLITKKGFAIINIDSVIVAQEPKLKPYIQTIQTHLETTLSLDSGTVSVKATTSEKIGFEGSYVF